MVGEDDDQGVLVEEILPQNQYRIRIDRGKRFIPQELVEFFPGGVDPWERTRHRMSTTWCRRNFFDISLPEVIVLAKTFTEEEAIKIGARSFGGGVCLEMDWVVAWGIKNDWCPTDIQELIHVGIDPKTRHLQLERKLVGYGTIGTFGKQEYIWVLGNTERHGRHMRCEWSGAHGLEECFYLFVRSAPPL